MVPEVRIIAPLVEVISPRGAPHLLPIAAEIAAATARELERAIPDCATARRVAEFLREQAEPEDAFRVWRRTWWARLGL